MDDINSNPYVWRMDQVNEDMFEELRVENLEPEDLLDTLAIQDQTDGDPVDVWRCWDTVRPKKNEEVPVLARLS